MNPGPAFIQGDGTIVLEGRVPEQYDFPKNFDPGVGLERTMNSVLLTAYSILGRSCNSLKALEMLRRHGLDTTSVDKITPEQVRNEVEGEGGILAIMQSITVTGGNPVPVPYELTRAVLDVLKPYNPFPMAVEVAPFNIPDEDLMMHQENLGLEPIVNQFAIPLGVPAYDLNLYMSVHYQNMARLFNKILARRMRRHLLPGSYNNRTRELATVLMEMKLLALRMKNKIKNDGLTPFVCPTFAVHASADLARLVNGLV